MYKIIGANQVEYGPISAEQLRQWITEGRVNAQTLAQAEGETGWRAISTFPEFASNFPAAPATPPSTPPSGVPGAPQPATPDSGRAVALSQMSGPAIALMVIGVLGILASLWSVVTNIAGSAFRQNQFQMLEQQNPQIAHIAEQMTGTVGILYGVLGILVWALVIYSAVKMKNLQNYGLCIAGCICAMLPCNCCCCIGIPIAIWALIMLNKTDIKRYFT